MAEKVLTDELLEHLADRYLVEKPNMNFVSYVALYMEEKREVVA